MTIRIDQLDSTGLPNRAHEVPAMRDGVTVKLMLSQILGLATAEDAAFDPDGTGLTATDVQAALVELLAASLLKSGNLSGLADPGVARTNLGLGTAAVQADTRYAHRANNLSDLANPATARGNLGAAPMPISGTGLGNFTGPSGGPGDAFVLPSGGTWAYFAYRRASGAIATEVAGVAAGGTTVAAGSGSDFWRGLIWQVQ
jgi:hypothetical protein